MTRVVCRVVTRRKQSALAAMFLASAGVAAAADLSIFQKNREFSVRQVTIDVGERITFVNSDTVTHNVYSETKGSEFEIELQPPGRSDSVRFSRPGIVEIRCAIHPNMRLRVEVRP